MDSSVIYEKANSLVKQCKTRDSLQIAKETGISIFYSDKFENLLGLYTYQWKHRIIILNSRIGEYTTQLVTAHELGHDKLHRELAKADGLMEFAMTDTKNSVEREANIFAAHILLDNDKVECTLKQGHSIETAAKLLYVDKNILMIKIKEMNKLGYRIPFTNEHDMKFLNRINNNL